MGEENKDGQWEREIWAHAHGFLATKRKPQVIKRKPLDEPKPLALDCVDASGVQFRYPVDDDLLTSVDQL